MFGECREIFPKIATVFLTGLILLQLLYSQHIHRISSFSTRLRKDLWKPSAFEQTNVSNNTARHVSFSTVGLPQRPLCSPKLEGNFVPNFTAPSFHSLSLMFDRKLKSGGVWNPSHCVSNGQVAVIVPFRDRKDHLRIFLHNIHNFLSKQMLGYQIFVVEQIPGQIFNRAKLMNVGFLEVSNVSAISFTCFVFHDVDLIPLNDTILYNCSQRGPMHLAVAMDKFSFNMPYVSYFGGITAFTPEQFREINGFTNQYWGWGGEDDEAHLRVHFSHQRIQRYPKEVARYSMMKHGKDLLNPSNPSRGRQLRKTAFTWRRDGLNSIKYKLVSTNQTKLYTVFLVDLFPPFQPFAMNFSQSVEPMMGIEKSSKERFQTKRRRYRT